jgi:murein DD-endopeptidase MepM/ murein hydrolase activator NlpD
MDIFYYHLKEIDVVKGQQLSYKQRVGRMGRTGIFATGIHVHWEIRFKGKYINPVCSSTWNKLVIEEMKI